DSVDRINGPHKIALVTEWHGGIDAHTPFEHGVGGGPFALARGHAFGRHKCLAAAAGKRIDNVRFRIDAGGEVPNDIVHVVGIGVFAHRDDHTGTLGGSENRGHEIALPSLFDAVTLLDLNDRSAPIGHAVRNVHV